MSVDAASRIIIDDSTVMLQIVASLNGNSRGIIYSQNMFGVQATTYFSCSSVMQKKFCSIDCRGQSYKTFCFVTVEEVK
jgi:hypothetical protein